MAHFLLGLFMFFVFYIYTTTKFNKNILRFIEITKDYYVTSAFYDHRVHSIRILYGSVVNFNTKLTIIVDRRKKVSYKNVIYDKCISYDNDFDLKYGNTIIEYQSIPKSITINNINVPVIHNNVKNKYFLSVCITTMYNFNAKLMLTQMLEIYLSLGVNHFTIYYSSSSKEVHKVLKRYISKNIIKLIYWERDNNTFRMRNWGQYIKTNDCLYRYLNISDYVINTDLDEVILPLKYYNLPHFINNITKQNQNTTVILFSSKMFIKNETIDTVEKRGRADYLKVHKVSDVNLFTVKNSCYCYKAYRKYIVHVNDMIALDTHYVWEGNTNVYNVPYSYGYSRHTRRVTSYVKNALCKNIEYDDNLTKIVPLSLNKYLLPFIKSSTNL